MIAFRRFSIWSMFLLALASANAQFTLEIVPVSPGSANLVFRLDSGFYFSLEKSDSLSSGYTPASGWMLGNGTLVTWPIHYPTSPASSDGGSGTTATGDTFSVYPFDNGGTLVTWNGSSGALHRALIAQDYSGLPPLLTLSGSETAPYLTLLLGSLAWDPAYTTFDPALLTTTQKATLDRLTLRYAEVIAAATADCSGGSGVVIDSPKHFFRLRRVEADGDHDGLSWAQEVFVYGSDPNNADTDDDGTRDSAELAEGRSPTVSEVGHRLRVLVPDRENNTATRSDGNVVLRWDAPTDVTVESLRIEMSKDGGAWEARGTYPRSVLTSL